MVGQGHRGHKGQICLCSQNLCPRVFKLYMMIEILKGILAPEIRSRSGKDFYFACGNESIKPVYMQNCKGVNTNFMGIYGNSICTQRQLQN